MKTNTPYTWLKDRLLKKGSITTWHFNDDILMFTDNFYPNKKHKYASRKLSYYMRKLVVEGISKPSIRVGIGEGSVNDFGVRTQTIWEKNITGRR